MAYYTHYIKLGNMRKIIQEFKEFATKGNVIDLAVGVIIGGAFGKIIASLVSDVIMPPIGLLVNGLDFKNLKWVMSYNVDGSAGATLAYGSFIQNIVEFIIIAFTVFICIKAINRVQRTKKKEEAVVTPEDILLLREIRDSLKK